MKKYLTAVLVLSSLGANAQLFSGDIDDIGDQLKFNEGLEIKKDTKADVDPLIWDVETKGNTLVFKKKPKDEKMDKHVRVTVSYDDLSKSRPRITEMHQSIARKDGNKKIVERTITVNVKKQRVQHASLCEVNDELNKKSKLDCITVDKAFCYDLKQALKKSNTKSDHLKKCADSLSKMNGVIASSVTAKRLSKLSSQKKSIEAAGGQSNIGNSNGGILGSDISKQGSLALSEIFKMVSLCEDNNLGRKRGSKAKPLRIQETQTQSQKED